MADKRMQFTWDPIALAAQLRNIARQSQVLMRQSTEEPLIPLTTVCRDECRQGHRHGRQL
jgi:hypothetical protein